MDVAAHQEKKKREDRRSILKKLRAVLLRSFKGQHGKKMVSVRGVPGVTRTLRKANSNFNPIQKGLGDCTTTLQWVYPIVTVSVRCFQAEQHQCL